MKVCEIFKSLQGESTHGGKICSFVRLSGCNLLCSYCDTEYARTEVETWSIEEIVSEVRTHRTRLVEVTGGEPLLKPETPVLCKRFLELGYTVLVETNGTMDIAAIQPPIIRIVDCKCPSSGHEGSFLEKNFSRLAPADECKFVISDKADFYWALDVVRRETLHEIVPVLFSPNMTLLPPQELAKWIIEENAPVRLGVQLHKLLWGDRRGV